MCAVGVDNGGTWVRFVGLDPRGRRVWTLKKPSPRVPDLPAFLRQHLQRFHGKLAGLAVGSRGVWEQSKRQSVKRALQGLASKIHVMSDVEAAWIATFSPHPRFARPLPRHRGRRPGPALARRKPGEGDRRTGEGIIVISGTGSIAYGKTPDGKFARAGGLGPDKGDEGSGYWIGREWLKKTKRPRNVGTKSVREIAALAPMVLGRARHGDTLALGVVRQAQSSLANLVREVADKLYKKKKLSLSVSGSVATNHAFRLGFLRRVKKMGLQFKYIRPKTDAALALALSLISPPPSPLSRV
jgi:BadF/BadG/BcrA/BcrD ATPase family protein